MNRIVASPSSEREVSSISGWLMLPVVFLMPIAGFASIVVAGTTHRPMFGVLGIALFVLTILFFVGFYTLQPNQARVLVLFGDYRGTVRRHGFHWGNPFYSNGVSLHPSPPKAKPSHDIVLSLPKLKGLSRMRVSLRARNLNGDRLKVNDKQGNPIEIAAVVVWRVEDTAQALFDVDDYEEYVRVQSESALRHLGSQYAYDHGEEFEVTLRSGVDEVSHALKRELEQRLAKAGVAVEEARLTHLAYAPEIAQSMLRRQQADAVIAARKKIVLGAVSMVESAVNDLAAGGVIDLDAERRASMVSNLMVVLCSESQTQPVINTGTLYG
ncbi:MAG: SPFH domain-containing protein [Proteobacteria bacterium]|nr:MAG: SPFH domain-containing protein [Pseudomonadota bacterium]